MPAHWKWRKLPCPAVAQTPQVSRSLWGFFFALLALPLCLLFWLFLSVGLCCCFLLCSGLFEVVSRCGLRGLSFKVHRLRAPVPGLTSCTRFVVLAALLLVACLVRWLLGWSVCLAAKPFPVSRLAGSGSLSSRHRDPAGESISRVALSCLVCCVICCIICFLVSGCIVCCIVVLSCCCLLCAGFLWFPDAPVAAAFSCKVPRLRAG